MVVFIHALEACDRLFLFCMCVIEWLWDTEAIESLDIVSMGARR